MNKKVKIMIIADSEDVEKFKEWQKEYKKKGYAQSVLFREMVEMFKKNYKEF